MASVANRLAIPDLSWMPDEGLTPSRLRIELLSGLTVALALVPEAVAFAFVAGVHPLVGLYAAFLVGLITALIGGRPGMISGATGALAVVMVSLVAQHGVEYLFATVVLMGILQIIAGVMQWGRFIRLVPHPVMLGFVNGLAIVIFLAQMGQFKVPGSMENTGHGLGGGEWLSGLQLYTMLGLVALTMAVIWVMPRITRVVPAPLAGIVVVAAVVIGFGLDVPRVGDMASIEGGLPQFHVPMVPLTWETLNDKVLMLDLQYHDIRTDKSLYYILERNDLVSRVLTDQQIDDAVDNPPSDTRAKIRGDFIKLAKEKRILIPSNMVQGILFFRKCGNKLP